ncbi:hypothetical protein JHW43_009223 [Diplocarpon mali]|nr:hypothetical protein JHW43_009223 [Diplocarpon mali]
MKNCTVQDCLETSRGEEIFKSRAGRAALSLAEQAKLFLRRLGGAEVKPSSGSPYLDLVSQDAGRCDSARWMRARNLMMLAKQRKRQKQKQKQKQRGNRLAAARFVWSLVGADRIALGAPAPWSPWQPGWRSRARTPAKTGDGHRCLANPQSPRLEARVADEHCLVG